jgi:hypothetical protein
MFLDDLNGSYVLLDEAYRAVDLWLSNGMERKRATVSAKIDHRHQGLDSRGSNH